MSSRAAEQQSSRAAEQQSSSRAAEQQQSSSRTYFERPGRVLFVLFILRGFQRLFGFAQLLFGRLFRVSFTAEQQSSRAAEQQRAESSRAAESSSEQQRAAVIMSIREQSTYLVCSRIRRAFFCISCTCLCRVARRLSSRGRSCSAGPVAAPLPPRLIVAAPRAVPPRSMHAICCRPPRLTRAAPFRRRYHRLRDRQPLT